MVASIPLAGEAVTDTVEPAGSTAAWSIAFLSGISSNVGACEDARERRGLRVARATDGAERARG